MNCIYCGFFSAWSGQHFRSRTCGLAGVQEGKTNQISVEANVGLGNNPSVRTYTRVVLFVASLAKL